MKNKLLLITTFLTISFSCSRDKGNYDYKEISQVTIEGVDKVYNKISLRENLTIDPTVKSTNEADQLDYLWVVYPKLEEEGNMLDLKVDTLSKDRKLDYFVVLKSGSYTIDFYVKNRSQDEIVERYTTELRVASPFSLGFYVMKQLPGNSIDIDLHLKDNNKLENLLTTQNGKPLEGKAMGFGYYPIFGYFNTDVQKVETGAFLMPFTDKEMATMRLEDMTNIRNYDDWFFDAPEKYNPIAFFPNTMTFCYISSDNIYINVQYPASGMPGMGLMGLPYAIEEDKVGSCEPHKSMLITGMGFYLYDKKNGRFISGDYHDALKLVNDGVYKANNIKDEFLFMGECKVGGSYSGYALFNSTEGERLLYELDASKAGGSDNPILSIKTIPNNLKLKSATRFATSRDGSKMLYFESNNKLYFYDYIQGVEEELVFQGLEDGTITYFDTMFFHAKVDDFNHFIVATEKGGNYTIQLYDIVGGKPYGAAKQKLTGKGTPTAIQYASLEKEVDNYGDYSIHL